MPSRDIKDCEVKLNQAWPLIKADFEKKFKGWRMLLTCTHRTPEEQFELYKKGRYYNPTTKHWSVRNINKIVTNCDGDTKLSNHNYYPSRAFDVALQRPDRDLEWNVATPQWKSLITLAEKYGVVNGGSWTSFKDYPHFEV